MLETLTRYWWVEVVRGLALVIFIGISAIVFGITLLAFGIRLYMHRHCREERPVTDGHRPATA
jgi:hypothetical protein